MVCVQICSRAVAPIFGSFMQSAFAQNVGLVAITGIKSRFVVAAGGMILVVLGLLPIMGRLIAAIRFRYLVVQDWCYLVQWLQAASELWQN